MLAFTRRRDPDVAQETWRIYYGDVLAGTIAQCVGNPGAAPKWQWRCGFYPGSRPGECTGGTAATFGPCACGCGAPGAPCPVCNRSDVDTVPEMPERFVVDVKREDWD
jgi:hypothetical protein